MRDMFTRYNPNAPEKHRGSPVCLVSYPEPCGERAVGEGWGCLPFCERHWQEAELAAREELAYAVQGELDALLTAEKARPYNNAAVAVALFEAPVPGLNPRADRGPYAEALAAAYPTEGREDLIDPETLTFDYERYDGDGPEEWQEEARFLLLRFVREAAERGLSGLALELEGLRERATVQLILAEADYERRYAGPRRAARERAGG